MLVRTPRLEARTRTPGAILIEKPMSEKYARVALVVTASLIGNSGTRRTGTGIVGAWGRPGG
ncbi:hypothetical protein GCM10009790_26020 [Georgenia ruanii]